VEVGPPKLQEVGFYSFGELRGLIFSKAVSQRVGRTNIEKRETRELVVDASRDHVQL
jgi:hypothetical protein